MIAMMTNFVYLVSDPVATDAVAIMQFGLGVIAGLLFLLCGLVTRGGR